MATQGLGCPKHSGDFPRLRYPSTQVSVQGPDCVICGVHLSNATTRGFVRKKRLMGPEGIGAKKVKHKTWQKWTYVCVEDLNLAHNWMLNHAACARLAVEPVSMQEPVRVSVQLEPVQGHTLNRVLGKDHKSRPKKSTGPVLCKRQDILHKFLDNEKVAVVPNFL